MIKLGMKLFSTNCLQTPDFAASVIDYVNAHDDMFLELMAVPGSFEATHAFFGERVKASDGTEGRLYSSRPSRASGYR